MPPHLCGLSYYPGFFFGNRMHLELQEVKLPHKKCYQVLNEVHWGRRGSARIGGVDIREGCNFQPTSSFNISTNPIFMPPKSPRLPKMIPSPESGLCPPFYSSPASPFPTPLPFLCTAKVPATYHALSILLLTIQKVCG